MADDIRDEFDLGYVQSLPGKFHGRLRGGRPKQTHCGKGHPLSGDNLIITKGAKRQCRTCKNAHQLEYKRKMGLVTPKPHCTALAELIKDMWIETPHGRVPSQGEAVKAFNYMVKYADEILRELKRAVPKEK
jgi:hypothetical protein